MNYRKNISEYLELLSSGSSQLEYEKSLVGRVGNTISELVSMFCDDLYHPKDPEFVNAFSEGELKSLAEVYGAIALFVKRQPDLNGLTVSELLKKQGWRDAMAVAKNISSTLKDAS